MKTPVATRPGSLAVTPGVIDSVRRAVGVVVDADVVGLDPVDLARMVARSFEGKQKWYGIIVARRPRLRARLIDVVQGTTEAGFAFAACGKAVPGTLNPRTLAAGMGFLSWSAVERLVVAVGEAEVGILADWAGLAGKPISRLLRQDGPSRLPLIEVPILRAANAAEENDGTP